TWSGDRRYTWSRERSTSTCDGCASRSNGTMPSPSSSSPSGGLGTSSIPTLSISSAAGDLILVLVATAAGAAAGSLVGVYGTGMPLPWTVAGAVVAGGAGTITLRRRAQTRVGPPPPL